MQISVVRPDELSPEHIQSWREMQSSMPSLANPFMSPEFAVLVGKVRTSTRVAMLSDGSDVVGFFPFERGRFGAGGPIAPGLTDCQGLIHAPGLQWDARELLRACRLEMWEFDHLQAEQHPFGAYCTGMRPSPIIDLTNGFNSYYENLRSQSSNFCRNVERKARKLEREVGPLRFVVNSGDTSAFRRLLVWKSLQYQRTGQVDIFARPWVANLVEDLFGTRGGHFSGLFSVLYASDVPIAAHFGLRSADILAHWFPAYDIEFSKYSAGLILHLRLAEFTYNEGVRVIDMGTGIQRYKEELKSSEILVGFGAVSAGSFRSAVFTTANRAREATSRWLVSAVRQNTTVFKAAYWLRTKHRLARNAHQK